MFKFITLDAEDYMFLNVLYSKAPLTSHLCVVVGISTFRYGRKGSKRDEDVSPKNGHFFPLSPPTTRSLSWLGQILAWVVNRGLALTLYWM